MKIFMPAIKLVLFVLNGLLILFAVLNIISDGSEATNPWLMRLMWAALLIVFSILFWLQIKWIRKG